MSCVSRHQGRTAWCLPARDRGSRKWRGLRAGYLWAALRQGSVLDGYIGNKRFGELLVFQLIARPKIREAGQYQWC